MPIYVLYAKDKPGSLERRLEHYAEHRTFIETQDAAGNISVIVSGPLQTDDGEVMVGSMIVFEAQTREIVEEFVANDPFTREGVWGEVHISRFYRRYMPGQMLPPP